MLRIELIKSQIGNNPRNRATVRALGLRKMHQVVVHEDTPSIRGMIFHAKHMLSVTVVDASAASTKPSKSKSKPKAEATATPSQTEAPAETVAEAPKPAKKARAKKDSEES